ncbi:MULTISPECIES: GTP-binding protein [Streptomyces]|uniref:GTP-binding protein n=1 Tax=Streptomyces TaxID=1883 RepID=UPI00224902BA|nr:ATP/GTP-binding protein [Streptomyces sp. JHD 1]MCX2968232.1 ATP/GTP-binding protein [Streptomyces sp. JHD 1]
MDCATSPEQQLPPPAPAPAPAQAFKLLIAGGFGVGKTTLVTTVSQTPPLSTEALMTEASRPVDDLHLVPDKQTTTVAFDFGRLDLPGDGDRDQPVQLLLFGAPGQARFAPMWDYVSSGALGAVVLVDTRRLHDCFPVIDYCEQRRLPFVVAVNRFAGDRHLYSPHEITEALQLGPRVPVRTCDARDWPSCKAVLITLTQHALTHRSYT